MWVKLLLIMILIIISLFCWLSLINPLDVEFHFFGQIISTNLSTLMITSFVLGALLVFISTLTRDARRAIKEYRQSRKKKREETLREELNRGKEYFLSGDFQKAKTYFVEILKKDPFQIDLYQSLSEIALKEKKEGEALQWLEKARLFDPKNIDLLLMEADIYQRMNRWEEALQTLNRITRLDENNLKALKRLREIYHRTQRWEEALQIQRSILKLIKEKKAEREEKLYLLGLQYERARELSQQGGKSLEEALKATKDLIREDKHFQPGFLLLGQIYCRMGKENSARKVWRKSFKRFHSILFLLRLEELYLREGDPSGLLHLYQEAIAENPQNWILSFFYAKLCLRLEMLDEALEVIQEISLRKKDLPALHRLLAELYIHKKDFSRAAQEFEKTFELSGTPYFPFICNVCKRELKEWEAFCPQCQHWNTYSIEGGNEKMAFPASISPSEPMASKFDSLKIPLQS
ncbi:MAG: tetratricopeptide repeat protein [Thermodesulfobacteriota bacterium]